jgi:hypothetical protein
MQFEELAQQWGRLDEKLERTLKLDNELLRLAITRPAQRRVDRMAFWPAFDVALCALVLVLNGGFLYEHWGTWSLVAPAGVIMAAAILLLADSTRQLIAVSEINWDGAVAEIQRSLSQLRIMKIRQFKWVILLSPLVGFCGFILGLQWLFDWLPGEHLILDKLNPWWVAANYAFGLLFIPFGHAVIRVLAKRFGYRGWWQDLLDGIRARA